MLLLADAWSYLSPAAVWGFAVVAAAIVASVAVAAAAAAVASKKLHWGPHGCSVNFGCTDSCIKAAHPIKILLR